MNIFSIVILATFTFGIMPVVRAAADDLVKRVYPDFLGILTEVPSSDVISFKTIAGEQIAWVEQDGSFHLTQGVTPEAAADIAAVRLDTSAFCASLSETEKNTAAFTQTYVYAVKLTGVDNIRHTSWTIGLTPDGRVDYKGDLTVTEGEDRFMTSLAKHIACTTP